jgi:GxxExxY protein
MLGFDVKQQHPITVYDQDGTIIGEYLDDLLVDNRLVIELKVAKALADEHVAQLLNYLKGSRIEHGLLINFGSYKFQIKKYVLSDTLRRKSPNRLTTFPASVFFAFSALFCG